jgi:major membrane immunogen (membrane-anchored lipoprotein)
MKRALIIVFAAVLPMLVAACGESTDVTVYKQGKYQGKPDTAPWDNAQFKGDKVAWETAIKKRNEGQNEYSRGTPTPN